MKANVISKPYKKKSHLLLYPDGQHRLITMSEWHWSAIRSAEIFDIGLDDILECALKLAAEVPSGKGFEADVVECTCEMIRSFEARRRSELSDHAND